jgi:threonine dehydratase
MTAVRAVEAPTARDLAAAEQVVLKRLAPTPVVGAPALGPNALLKVETLQPTGSFKVRGALAALAAAAPERPVVTVSAGNHGLGLAHAAALLHRAATVVVPETASRAKIERLRGFGVELVLHGDGYDAAEAHALALADAGALFVSPYNDPHVIAGQRTLAVELGEQVDGPMTVVVPVGGGGLLAGVALWAADRADVRVVGVEAAASRSLSAAVAAGTVVDVAVEPTLADGMAGGLEKGSVTVPIAAERVDAFVAVGEAELRAGMRSLALDHGLVVEGAGAAAPAAVLAGYVADDRSGAHVAALVTGRNVTAATVLDVLAAAA